ncbi:MAG: DUF1801 domain-containing protein [Anaerolineae bacterium]|nr:DUF1801 domain-containing protein [Anaerolineae bacterium]NUQ04279.1 DUF1801 domain-containing protein [Anaerolineae bacterium]
MAEVKTRQTDQSVEAFLAAVEDEATRADCQTLVALMQAVSGEPPKMWGDTIVGFGKYHYKYASGHAGDSFWVGFSPRKQNLTLYLSSGMAEHDALLGKLGKHKIGKSCLYVTRLKDVDMTVLRQMVASTVAYMRENYPA